MKNKCIGILFWLLVWQLLALFVDNEIILVTPLKALEAFLRLLGQGMFWQTIAVSLCRIGMGFGLGMILALLLAIISSRFVVVEELLAPLMTLCRAVPVAVFVVLLLIWWGASSLASCICFLMVLPNIYISTLTGLKNTDKKLLEMASIFRLPMLTRFFYIYRPQLKPFLNSSLKLTLGMCWKSGVAAEVIGTPQFSIGEQLYLSKIHLDTPRVFAWAVVIILLSAGFERLILWMAERFWKWEPECWKESGKLSRDLEGMEEIKPLILCAEGICKSYEAQRVLEEKAGRYESGKIYYLTSPSGSGKTTWLRILCGLEKADKGRITPELTYSMVFQEDRLCEEYSALRNVELVVGSEEKAKEALGILLEEDAWDKPCDQLSGGMKRRVALIRALESSSQCVLLDEPFTGMDAETRSKAEDYIRARQGNRIVIIVTHI